MFLFFNTPAKQTSLEKHQNDSANAFSIFKQTITDLSNSNKRIEIDVVTEEKIIAEATSNKEKMLVIKNSNSKLITKITEFFEL